MSLEIEVSFTRLYTRRITISNRAQSHQYSPFITPTKLADKPDFLDVFDFYHQSILLHLSPMIRFSLGFRMDLSMGHCDPKRFFKKPGINVSNVMNRRVLQCSDRIQRQRHFLFNTNRNFIWIILISLRNTLYPSGKHRLC